MRPGCNLDCSELDSRCEHVNLVEKFLSLSLAKLQFFGYVPPRLRWFSLIHQFDGYKPVASPEFPGYEALEGGVALVDQGATSGATEAQGALEALGLSVVEDVALAVVGRGGTWWLVAELRASLNW